MTITDRNSGYRFKFPISLLTLNELKHSIYHLMPALLKECVVLLC